MDTMDRVAELMVTIEEFSELLDEETSAIRAANAKGVATLLDRKQYLAGHYTRQMAALSNYQADLAGLDESVKSMLLSAWRQFSERKDENIRALQVAQKATRHVVDLLVSAIREARSANTERSYGGAYGIPAQAGMPSASSCVSIALNRVL
jgi:hypothetical protein